MIYKDNKRYNKEIRYEPNNPVMPQLMDGSIQGKLVVPNGTRVIHTRVFQGVSQLDEIDMPESVLTLDSYLFVGCNSLRKIVCRAVTPPSITDRTFNSLPTACKIYVPKGSLDIYKTARYWSTLAARIEAI